MLIDMTYTTETTTRPELTDLTNADGSKRMAGPGGVRQTGGNRPVKECGACGGAVAFVESKNGKWYLADCFMGRSGGYYYVKASPHFKTCGERVAQKAEMRRIQDERAAAEAELEALRAKVDLVWNELWAWEREHEDAGTFYTKEAYIAKRAELCKKHGVA